MWGIISKMDNYAFFSHLYSSHSLKTNQEFYLNRFCNCKPGYPYNFKSSAKDIIKDSTAKDYIK